MKSLKLIFASTFLLSALGFFTACQDDETQSVGEGQVNVKITDAPIDDAEIKGAYVTIAEVWVNGVKAEGFTKKTIDLMAYQNGNTLSLISDTLTAGTYSDVSLVLDLETDQSGNSPGCFILTEDVVKHNLAASGETTAKIDLEKQFDVQSDGVTDIVIDFDLRKAIKYDNTFDAESEYSFVTQAELKSALRPVIESKSAKVKGSITQSAATGERLFVYAYKKGEFEASTETTGQGPSLVFFANAVTSAEVSDDNKYELSFIEEGEYELHIAAYDNDGEGKPVFTSMVSASAVGSTTLLNNVQVNANTDVSLNINITGLLKNI